MPASSETRNRWRKRKRDPKITRKPIAQPQDEDDDVLDDEDEDELDLDQQQLQPEFDEEPNNLSDPVVGPVARESEVLSDGGVRVSNFPPVVRHTVNRHHSSVLAIVRGQQTNGVVLENVSYGQLQALSTVGDIDLGAYVITPPMIMEGRGVVKTFGPNLVHVVPMHADWFSPTTVNRLERQAVPHFFSGKSVDHTPEKYMECRNRIVAKCMENPAKRLSAFDCHGFIVGVDTDDIARMVRFLDNWGVINYCAAPNHDSRSDGSYLIKDSKGELCVPVTALKSIDSLIQFDKPKCRLKAADIYPELVAHGDENSDLDSRIREQLSENRCNHCTRPLAVVYYQSQKEIDLLLCLDCFNEGVFVAGHSSLDFVRVDATKDYGDLDGDSWTDQETLLLLEAMELYKENWNEIAEHVVTKSKAQCILHFIHLSIDDAPLENIEVPSTSNSSNLSNGDVCGRPHLKTNGSIAGSSLEGPEIENRLPFANSGNPVMSQVAFLASAVGPRVAAACAHASLASLSENVGLMDGTGSNNRMTSESKNDKEGGLHADGTNSVQQKEETYGVQGLWTQGDSDVAPLSSEKVRNAARVGLAAAAMKAKLFADHEEREIQRLSANIINHQLKRLELKLKQFAEVETLLMKECEQVERARQRIAAECALMLSTQFGQAGPGVTRPTGLPVVGPAMVNNNTGTSRQQVSGSPSQPFISGYGNNQSIHPHMSQQQPMYGLGPRLPLSAINPSSSSVTTHPMLRPVSGSRPSFD